MARIIPSGLRTNIERVAFKEPRQAEVSVIRGEVSDAVAFSVDRGTEGLFDAADSGELDRIAFAVDGVESRHGADLRMWRPEPDGPQGPMQVSAKAALDVGGGDRFDPQQNRLLGRAYLAQMFRRYGNWADAIAAYNWGPGNMDQWITGGRNVDRLPIGVVRYTNRVLRDALLTRAASL
ncbi:MAG: lytic transglycosylase domain-containing protein [Alphaproteobacteria bacterium]|nr:lytic transglycosylase domain-containing protein [Alphaproteobacteria bacterium]